MPKYGLNGSTLQLVEQAEEIRLAGAAGFDLLELRAPKIEKFLTTGSLDELKTQLAAAGLELLSINALEQTDTRPLEEVRAECEHLAQWAQALGCPYIVAVPGFREQPLPETEIILRTVDRLAPLAEICSAHGVRLGFEFLGFANCTVHSLQLARAIIDKLASPHAGLVVDTCHFYLSSEPVELLGEIEPGQLLIFHVNDVEDRPRAELRDPHRLLPGRGVIPLQEMWDTLRRRELIDHASLELFRPEYWQCAPEEFLPEALDSLRHIFS